MIIPIRCFTCNKVIGHLWETYTKLKEEGIDDARMLIGHVDITSSLLKYNPLKKRNPNEAFKNMA